MNQSHIRNFAIIAHIDHGKSTLADRLLELTHTVAMRDMQAQILDSNPIERERGITIKLAPVRMHYSSTHYPLPTTHSEYILNLIDTPGHVDFGYEVSRSLAACEGAILVVDATQGVQAQTLANLHQARLHNLTVIPVINKIDMPHAMIAETWNQLHDLGLAPGPYSDEYLSPDSALTHRHADTMMPILISAKTGKNVEQVLEAVVTRVPPPHGDPSAPLRALIFSSQFDIHKGVVVFVRVVDGTLPFDTTFKGLTFKGGSQIHFLASNASVAPIEVGYFMPQMVLSKGIGTGEVGYIATGLKDVSLAKVGDTVTIGKVLNASVQPTAANEPLAGYKEPKPMVFLSLFPINANEFSSARELLEKLRLSDSAFTFRPISSAALGNGFHCGFLGLLHAEIVQERLSREFALNMIATAPSVEYHLTLNPGVSLSKLGFTASSLVIARSEATRQSLEENEIATPATSSGSRDDKTTVAIQSATEFPDPTYIDGVKEPIMQVKIFTPKPYVGAVMQLAQEKRGEYIDLKYLGEQAEFTYLIPLSDMIIDFFDRLKSISEGYASLDYEFFDFQAVDVAKIDILVNHEKVDALSFLCVRAQAHHRSISIVERLAEVIPRQQFQIPIQAAIGGQIVARADVKAFRKDVIQKLYGGDRTRKDKLLKKQAKGKARMKMVGSVQIPQSAFFEVLKRE